jgi:hypothetical protein
MTGPFNGVFRMHALLVAALAFVACPALAYCPPNLDYSRKGEYARADIVAVVKVLGVTWLGEARKPISNDDEFYSGADYRVAVLERFKGDKARRLTIFSENTSARTPLDIGGRYIVFLERQKLDDADRRAGDLMIDYCGNSEVLPAGAGLLEALRHGEIQ